eukprot:COSAG06_NODE_795_length_12228_cov_51.650507_8_plen_50_part_00
MCNRAAAPYCTPQDLSRGTNNRIIVVIYDQVKDRHAVRVCKGVGVCKPA